MNPPTMSWAIPGGGRAANVAAGTRYAGTTSQLCGLFPFSVASGAIGDQRQPVARNDRETCPDSPLSAAAGRRVRLPLLHPAPFEVAAGQNWGVSMVPLCVRDVPVVVTLAGHFAEIPADAFDHSSHFQCVRLPVPANSRRSSPPPPSRPLGAVISDSVWGASVVGSGTGERRA